MEGPLSAPASNGHAKPPDRQEGSCSRALGLGCVARDPRGPLSVLGVQRLGASRWIVSLGEPEPKAAWVLSWGLDTSVGSS